MRDIRGIAKAEREFHRDWQRRQEQKRKDKEDTERDEREVGDSRPAR
jgi:hypothetical protein